MAVDFLLPSRSMKKKGCLQQNIGVCVRVGFFFVPLVSTLVTYVISFSRAAGLGAQLFWLSQQFISRRCRDWRVVTFLFFFLRHFVVSASSWLQQQSTAVVLVYNIFFCERLVKFNK